MGQGGTALTLKRGFQEEEKKSLSARLSCRIDRQFPKLSLRKNL